jgi:hypothetical protein
MDDGFAAGFFNFPDHFSRDIAGGPAIDDNAGSGLRQGKRDISAYIPGAACYDGSHSFEFFFRGHFISALMSTFVINL